MEFGQAVWVSDVLHVVTSDSSCNEERSAGYLVSAGRRNCQGLWTSRVHRQWQLYVVAEWHRLGHEHRRGLQGPLREISPGRFHLADWFLSRPFTARSVAGLVGKLGLLTEKQPGLLEKVFEDYEHMCKDEYRQKVGPDRDMRGEPGTAYATRLDKAMASLILACYPQTNTDSTLTAR